MVMVIAACSVQRKTMRFLAWSWLQVELVKNIVTRELKTMNDGDSNVNHVQKMFEQLDLASTILKWAATHRLAACGVKH